MPFWSSKSKSKLKVDPASAHAGGCIPKSPISDPRALRSQFPTPGSVETKIRLAMLSTAMVDALGGPAEFHKRFSFDLITTMLPNENFPGKLKPQPGIWTDDTSMTLCLARSLAAFKETPDSPFCGGFDEVDQLNRYKQWYEEGYLSSVDKCFDIGNTVKLAISVFSKYSTEEALLRIRSDLGAEQYCGNGSLMRVLPIGLSYWRDEEQAKIYARRSSQTTHPSTMCIEACEVWTGAICRIMEASVNSNPSPDFDDEDSMFSKLSVVEFISNFPFTDNALRESLTLPFGVPMRPEGRAEREAWYFKYHPLLRLITETQSIPDPNRDPRLSFNIPSTQLLPSTGYVRHTIVAALYCFLATRTFEDGAIMAVNLGDDADTVGAIYAGLAACFYAGEEGGRAEGVFWTKRVREWLQALVRIDLIEKVSEGLVGWEKKVEEEF
ncbi:ADP-ribosylglycohydrolase-domain-containing protein [Panaeolus papilionaceus]|nr:ADP-ribosylglycohydrolase-domain-containing protein [Panaeolus papilionaceus]